MTHHKVLLLLVVLAFLQADEAEPIAPSSAVGAALPPVPCLPGEAAALLRLKRSFAATVASVRTLASWRAGTDCCGWDGVRCGGHDGSSITWLDLGGRGLQSAALDPAVFNLTSLRYLNLARNDFSGSELPSAGFERLTQLTHLNLSNANFSGAIPADSIGSIVSLVSIDLSVSDDVPSILTLPNLESLIANLMNLRELRLDRADMSSDNGAEWCSALAKHTPDLRVLTLQHCYISGPICGSFSGLRSLSMLDLGYNFVSGSVPDFFANFSSLTQLQLTSNSDLQGWFPSIILQQTNLVTVDISNNPGISGQLPSFSAGSNLEELILSGTNFSGKLPSSIGNLKSLKKLDLGVGPNQPPGFSGTIPSSIGTLTSLELLALSGFGLIGPIPSWIANLTSLTILRLSECGLSGPIPSSVGKLKMLKELTLSNCKFYGNIPLTISNLTQMEILDLQSNNFSGTVQLSLFMRLPNLLELSLSSNNLVVVDGDQNSSSLVYPRINFLRLSFCGIERLPKALRHLGDDIRWLDLSHNQIQGEIPQWAWKTWSGYYFLYLDLSHNKFTSFAGLDTSLPFSVGYFDLSFNMFEGTVPLPKTKAYRCLITQVICSHTCHLTFPLKPSFSRPPRNNLTQNILASFCGISSLEILDLSYNNLRGPIPSCLMEGTSELKVLNLKRNRLHGELPHINKHGSCSFEVLDFGDNELEGKLPRSLAACENLQVLDIQNNQISDSFPCWMRTLGRLQVLVLKSNEFFGQVGPSAAHDKNSCEFPSIQILDLASNYFSGTLAKEWLTKLKSMMVKFDDETRVYDGDVDPQQYEPGTELTYKGSDLTIEKVLLRNLAFLDVSNNNFQGSIPAAIGELVLLDILNMSHNFLKGPIPSQFGHLTHLEALDLSSNELSGEIPLELASLDFLETLNLSKNNLVGSIPDSPHFMTFSNGSFLGNSGLCGPPLSKECINRTAQSVVSHHSKKNSVDVMLFLFSGIGFGVGFAIAIVVAWGIPIRKRS